MVSGLPGGRYAGKPRIPAESNDGWPPGFFLKVQ